MSVHLFSNKKQALAAMVAALAVIGTGARAQAPAQPVAGDAARGGGKAAMCIGCHGIPGYQATFPEVYKVPKISGQNARYLAASLAAYRKGERKHPTMRAIAASLSDEDMADLAAFYEQQGRPAGQAAAAGAATPPARPLPEHLRERMAACTACHGANFSAPIDASYPLLAGQHADYLTAALRAYQTDRNQHIGRSNAMMRGQLVQEVDGQPKANFSHAELKQIGQYLASLPGELRVVPEPRLR